MYSEIPAAQDVDGAHFISRIELAGGQAAVRDGRVDLERHAPVTPLAVLRLLKHYGVCLEGCSAVVVGRSRIVGMPLAYMLGARGALVTLAHADVAKDKLAKACADADLVVSCAGSSGLVRPDWIKAGAVVISVGSEFKDDRLMADMDFELHRRG